MSKTILGGITNRVLMTAAAGLLVLSYVSAFIDPARAWFLVLPGLLFFPFVLLNLFLLVWALVRKSRAFVIPLVALLPTLFFVGRYFQAAGSGEDVDTGGRDAIRIVTYNVGRFAFAGKSMEDSSRKVCEDSIFRFMENAGADIICLQEYYADNRADMTARLSKYFRDYDFEYYVFTGKYGCFGNVILSRLPIVDKGVVKFDHSTNLALFTDIMVGGDRFRLYNCHFESYNISFPGIVKAIGEKSRKIFRETEEKMRHSLSLRPKQVDKVMRHIADCPFETVLCGDFNDNPMSYTYQRLIHGHSDTFCEAGKGFGATYSMLWPALRIDYVFIPESCASISHFSPKLPYSDHYPVVSDFVVKGK